MTAVCPGFVTTGTPPPRASRARTRRRNGAGGGRRRLYGLRNHPPEKAAAAVLRAVMRDEAVVPVTPEARTAYVVARWLPGVARRIARVKPPV